MFLTNVHPFQQVQTVVSTNRQVTVKSPQHFPTNLRRFSNIESLFELRHKRTCPSLSSPLQDQSERLTFYLSLVILR